MHPDKACTGLEDLNWVKVPVAYILDGDPENGDRQLFVIQLYRFYVRHEEPDPAS
jgi:hypothetical protein